MCKRACSTSPRSGRLEGADPAATPLSPSDRTIARTTISAEDGTADVALKVRFCRVPNCTAFEDGLAPTLWFAIGDPFYAGEITEWTTSVELPATAPTDATCADACDDFECEATEAECESPVHRCGSAAARRRPGLPYCRMDADTSSPSDRRQGVKATKSESTGRRQTADREHPPSAHPHRPAGRDAVFALEREPV
jgi:hypothetical protein